MVEATAVGTPEAAPAGDRSRGLLWGISAGHGVKHFGQGAVLILVPEVKATLALSDVAVGAMFGARDAASGLARGGVSVVASPRRRRGARTHGVHRQ